MPTSSLNRTVAGDRWRAMLLAVHEQSSRLADPDWTPAADGMQLMVQNFRVDPFRTGDAVLDVLLGDLGPQDTVIDIGAGAGRFALPIARKVREVIALEPSSGMRTALEADASQAGISNLRTLPVTWPTDDLEADAILAAHVVYPVREIEDFLLSMTRSARRWAAIVSFADPPQERLFGFWQAVFGEQRLLNPHLPQIVEVLGSLELEPEVTVLDAELWPLGPLERARAAMRSRLPIVPDSAADKRLDAAIGHLLVDWDGRYGPADRSPIKVAVVRWRSVAQTTTPLPT